MVKYVFCSILVAFLSSVSARSYHRVKPALYRQGKVATPGQFPYQAMLVDATVFHEYICGAAVLSPTAVLTAAVCVRELKPQDVNVVFGESVLQPYETAVQVDKIIVHEDFHGTPENDLAIVKTVEATAVMPIPLADGEVRDKDSLVFTGWASDSNNMERDQLLYSENFFLDRTCTNRTVSKDSICARSLAVTGCFKDAGSLLALPNGKALIGVYSIEWNPLECRSAYPSRFVDVRYHRQWILNALK